MKPVLKWMACIGLIMLALAGCRATPITEQPAPGTEGTITGPVSSGEIAAATTQPAFKARTLTVMTHDSFSVSDAVIADFEKQNDVKVNFLLGGDTGSMLNRAILTKEAPLADVIYGVDNTFLTRALEADIFEPYNSPALAGIQEIFKLDPKNRALPVDYGDVCINYDRAYFSEKNLAVPETLSDLIKPEYKGMLVVENPATSSPGLAFLLATVAEYGEENYLDYWRLLQENGVVVVNDWSTAYYTNFSGSSGKGPQPMVVSYASSPAVEVVFATTPLEEPLTASIVGPKACFRQIEFVGIVKGTGQRDLAEKWVDFMLGITFQEDIPMQMFVYPVNPKAQLPEVFVKFSQIPEEPAMLPIDLIAEKRDQWIKDWTDVVLR